MVGQILQVDGYAYTMPGIFQLAFDRLHESNKLALDARDDAECMIYTGRAQAWSELIKLATGRPGLDAVAVQMLATIGVNVDGEARS